MFKKKVIFILIVLLLFISSCTEHTKETPFFDGLLLEYNAGGIRLIFNFEELGNNEFKIIQTEKREPLRNKVEELFVDAQGNVYKSSNDVYEGSYSIVWIPVDKLIVGDTYEEFSIENKGRWKKWDVYVVKNLAFDEIRYYELKTGYLVGIEGKFGMAYHITLDTTNASIPIIE